MGIASSGILRKRQKMIIKSKFHGSYLRLTFASVLFGALAGCRLKIAP